MFNLSLLHQLFATIQSNYNSNNQYAVMRWNKRLLDILYFLKINGFIIAYRVDQKSHTVKIYLKYHNSQPLFFQTQVFAKSGQINVKSYKQLRLFSHRHPFAVISTNQGLMFTFQAVRLRVGGIPLFEIKI